MKKTMVDAPMIGSDRFNPTQTTPVDRKLGALRLWVGVFALWSLFWPAPAVVAQQPASLDPRRVEAFFLRNFTRYVAWPESVFADRRAPWHICILGDDPFGEILEETFQGHTEKGRSFSIQRTKSATEARQCQVVYVGYQVSMNRRAALAELEALPVLTVSNAKDFLSEGGIIRFDVSNHVTMNINLDRARAASLSIQTKMLEVADLVIDNGKIRRVR